MGVNLAWKAGLGGKFGLELVEGCLGGKFGLEGGYIGGITGSEKGSK
jgi:hypothetical protein